MIDLEHVNGLEIGIVGGDWGKRGLIRSVGRRHVDLVMEAACEFGVNSQAMRRAKHERLEEIEEHERLRLFHSRKGLLQEPSQPIDDDIASLGLHPCQATISNECLNYYETSDRDEVCEYRMRLVTLGEVAKQMLADINQILLAKAESSPSDSVKSTRKVLLRTKGPYIVYRNLPEQEKRVDKLWMHRICEALLNHDRIFKWEENGYGFHIQA